MYFAYVVYDICIKDHIRDFAENIKGRLEAWKIAPKQRLQDKNELGGAKLNLKRADIIILVAVTLIYGVFSFVGLGTTSFPQTYWQPTYNQEYVIGDLGSVRNDAQYLYYVGSIGNGSFTVEVSDDKVDWEKCTPTDSGNVDKQKNVTYDYGDMYKWHSVKLTGKNVRYVKITSVSAGFNLLEVGVVDKDMVPIAIKTDSVNSASREHVAENLFDEQNTVPDRPSYYNSMYFDEIYHARTGYEFVHGMDTYETTHPQLGKVFMAWSIEAFGMTPFAWRLPGNIFGILMLPLVYLFAKLMFKKTWIAALAMGMMTFDGMHFVQTRIATIDVFGVFFIILMYFFMYKYYTMNFYKDKLSKTFIPLGLCGLAFGLGAASKWICLYAGAGLALLLFYTLYKRYDEYIYAKKHIDEATGEEREQYQFVIDNFAKYTVYTLLFCVGFFVVIPVIIYVASYAYFVPYDKSLTYLEAVLKNQEYMLNYHSGLSADTHPYRSSWYTWPVIGRPTWYYNASLLPYGSAGTIAVFGNPIVWIGALIGTIAACVQGAIDRKKIDLEPMTATEPIYNNRDLIFLLVGLAAQFVPWIFVPRSTFIYHYFASVPFIVLLTGLVAVRAYRVNPKKTRTFIIWALVAMAVVFAIFYPVWSGTVIPQWYREALRILPSWYF